MTSGLVFTSVDTLLWGASWAGQIALLTVLIWRKRWRTFPVFTIQFAFHVLVDCVGFILAYGFKAKQAYAWFYWVSTVLDFLLQMAIVVEIARIVLRPTGTWVRDAKKQFVLMTLAGVALATAFAGVVTPPSPTLLDSFVVRAELFSSLLMCELVLTTSLTSNSLGLGWRNHVMAIGQGLMGWSLVAVIVDGLHSYFGSAKYFTSLEHVRIVTYLAALGYWCVQLWHEEPARLPISPQLRQYIVALHRRVNYDLGEARR